MSWKSILVIAVISLASVAVALRVPAVRRLVFGAAPAA